MANKIQSALRRARHADKKFNKAEGWRTGRNYTMLDTLDAGASQTQIATTLGMSQQTVSSILRHTGQTEEAPAAS